MTKNITSRPTGQLAEPPSSIEQPLPDSSKIPALVWVRVAVSGTGVPVTGVVGASVGVIEAVGVSVVASLDEALGLAAEVAGDAGASELVVIGGAEIYRLAIPRADRLYVTEVHADIEGDARLPDVAWAEWEETRRDRHAAAENSHDFSFVVYDRRKSTAN